MLKFMSYMLAYSRYIAIITDTALNTNLVLAFIPCMLTYLSSMLA